MDAQTEKSGNLNFSVDAELLRELGERLVGKPDIALGELVKNSYDADATKVEIIFEENCLEVVDNGHGMSLEDIERLWLRVGSTHKQKLERSRDFKRPLTGSKGIGRLSVQFLADNLKLRTVSKTNTAEEIITTIDWNKAIASKDLIKAKLAWERGPRKTVFPEGKKHGTKMILGGLKQSWTIKELQGLAREIWILQPPFKPNSSLSKDKKQSFAVEVKGVNRAAIRKFNAQMTAAFKNWEAKISGKLFHSNNGEATAKIVVEYDNGRKIDYEYATDGLVHEIEFEIRIFRLKGNQKRGVLVEDAKDYMNRYGGVHIYDAGFHLPYYGPDTDWLNIERDHARRKGASDLLPENLLTDRALNALPTQRRIFGIVHVNTSREKRTVSGTRRVKQGNYLQIQLTRDRLVNNESLKSLADTVRTALDFYANETQRTLNEEAEKKKITKSARESLKTLDEVLDSYKNRIPKEVFQDLKVQVERVSEASEGEARKLLRDTALLGPLATAGISAVALDHELSKQLIGLEAVSKDIRNLSVIETDVKERLEEIGRNLETWIRRARSTKRLFSPLLTEESREAEHRFNAKVLVKEVYESLGQFMRGIRLDLSGMDNSIRLPLGSFAQWYAIFQNIFINAVNAMLDSEERLVDISTARVARTVLIHVQDTGSGVNLKNAENLFQPFQRKSEISSERRRLGYGGTGLGLTIVKMIANNVNARVKFTEPGEGFATNFQISWSE